jgi:hypothetical protein
METIPRIFSTHQLSEFLTVGGKKAKKSECNGMIGAVIPIQTLFECRLNFATTLINLFKHSGSPGIGDPLLLPCSQIASGISSRFK